MAKLIESLALAGSRKSDGTPNASGKVWGYIIGTSTEAVLYSDRTGDTVVNQPVILDAAGKATIYVDQVVTLRVETAAGVSLGEMDYQDAAPVVSVQNDGFTGTLEDGSQGAGGETDLDAVLTSAFESFGATDFQFASSAGATPRSVASRIGEANVSIVDYGAVGDGNILNTSAIQAAINRVIALGGGVVFVPPGTFLTGRVTNFTTTPVSFAGVGVASILKSTETALPVIDIEASGLSGFEIRDLKITSSSATTSAAIVFDSVTKVLVRNITITGHTAAIGVSGTTSELDFDRISWSGSGNGITLAGVYGSSTISRSRLSANGSAIKLNTGTMTGVSIWGNVLVGATSSIDIVPTSSSPPVMVFGNMMSGTAFTTGASAPLQQFNNGIEGVSVTVTVDSTLVPDWRLGPQYRVNCTGAGKTIAISPPIPTPTVRGTRMHLRLHNNNGGVTTWTMIGIAVDAGGPSNVTLHVNEYILEYDIDRGFWSQLSKADHV